MTYEELLEIIRVLEEEILSLLHNNNLANDKVAQQTLLAIEGMFNRLDQAVEEVLPEEVLKSYYLGIEQATEAVFLETGRRKIMQDVFKSHVHMQAIVEITDNTMLDFKAALRTAKENTYFTLKTTLADVKDDLQKGILRGSARKEITKKVAESFAKDGLTSFITIDNRKLPLDFYSEVVTRTNLKMANVKGAVNRYKENGVSLFTVTGNTPTCSECFKYRGYVFSMERGNKDFPYLDPNIFPIHPNCQCSIVPFVKQFRNDDDINIAIQNNSEFNPNIDSRSKEHQKAYADKQALKRQNNNEKKLYANVKASLGNEAPKTLGAFKRMKRADTKNYKSVMQAYKNSQ